MISLLIIIIISFIVVALGISYFNNPEPNYFVKGGDNLYKDLKFYLISIDKSAELRKKNIKNLYDNIKKNIGQDIIQFGVDGEHISDREIIELKKRKFLKKDNFKYNVKNDKYLTKGEFGCFFSHLQAWEHMVDNNIKYGIVFEDDAKMIRNFKTKLDILMENLPENFHICIIIQFSR